MEDGEPRREQRALHRFVVNDAIREGMRSQPADLAVLPVVADEYGPLSKVT